MVNNGYQVCGVTQAIAAAKKDLVMVSNGYQICGVVEISISGNE